MTRYRVLVAGWIDIEARTGEYVQQTADLIVADFKPGRFALGLADWNLATSSREPVALPVNSEASAPEQIPESGAPFDLGITTMTHLSHALMCGCLNDSAECCRPGCDCHPSTAEGTTQ